MSSTVLKNVSVCPLGSRLMKCAGSLVYIENSVKLLETLDLGFSSLANMELDIKDMSRFEHRF